MGEILKANNLYKSFGRKQVLSDFNMSLEEGKVYGLLGKNGEGKTTLIRVIMGIIPGDKGKILYKGNEIKFNHPFYKREVGYIPEESIFFSWMTIKELMAFNSSFYPKWNAHKAKKYLDRFELAGKFRITNLSRGMKLILGDNFEQVKSRSKKVHLDFEGSVPDGIEIKGMLTKQTDDNNCDLGIYPWGEDVKKDLEALHPIKMNVESMTLEEIFIHFVS